MHHSVVAKGISNRRMNEATEEFEKIMRETPQPDVLSLYWSYEVPFLQLILSFLWKSVADGTTSDALHVDGPYVPRYNRTIYVAF